MLTDLLFLAFFFITRIVLPIIATYIVGVLIERALNRTARPAGTRAWKMTARHAG